MAKKAFVNPQLHSPFDEPPFIGMSKMHLLDKGNTSKCGGVKVDDPFGCVFTLGKAPYSIAHAKKCKNCFRK